MVTLLLVRVHLRCFFVYFPGMRLIVFQIGAFAGALYFGLTTLLNSDTIGEEYCDIMKVFPETPISDQGSISCMLPPLSSRVILFFVRYCVPYVRQRLRLGAPALFQANHPRPNRAAGAFTLLCGVFVANCDWVPQALRVIACVASLTHTHKD